MKIAVITERPDVALGGAERSVFELTSCLRTLGPKVEILAAKGNTNVKNIHILCPGTAKRTNLPDFETAVRDHLAQNYYDIIHSTIPLSFADVYQPRGGSFPEAGLRNAVSYRNSAMRFYKRATSWANFRRAVLGRAEKRICKASDGPIVAVLSEYVRQQFRRHYGLDDSRIRVIPNGVKIHSQPDVSGADKLRGQILAKLGINESIEPVFFLFVANNFRLKGLDPLLEAMHNLVRKKTARPAYLIVAGRDKPGRYRRIKTALRIKNRVLFIGPMPRIQNTLSCTDAAILPTYYDPASRFILEALGAEMPVITTRYNGACDLFTNNRHGKIIDSPGDITAMVDAMQFYTETANIKNAAEAIRSDNLAEKISITRHCTGLMRLYESIIRDRGNHQ